MTTSVVTGVVLSVKTPSSKPIASRTGLDPSRPLVVNENLVVLDGHTRLDIAKKLKLRWAWVTIKELDDHWTEKEFVIMSNLARRQLNTAQRADMGLKLLEIEQARARERQKLAGAMYGRGIKTPEPDSLGLNEYQAIPNGPWWNG